MAMQLHSCCENKIAKSSWNIGVGQHYIGKLIGHKTRLQHAQPDNQAHTEFRLHKLAGLGHHASCGNNKEVSALAGHYF